MEQKRERDRLYHLRNREKHLQYFRNRITFLGKQIQLSTNPRLATAHIVVILVELSYIISNMIRLTHWHILLSYADHVTGEPE